MRLRVNQIDTLTRKALLDILLAELNQLRFGRVLLDKRSRKLLDPLVVEQNLIPRLSAYARVVLQLIRLTRLAHPHALQLGQEVLHQVRQIQDVDQRWLTLTGIVGANLHQATQGKGASHMRQIVELRRHPVLHLIAFRLRNCGLCQAQRLIVQKLALVAEMVNHVKNGQIKIKINFFFNSLIKRLRFRLIYSKA